MHKSARLTHLKGNFMSNNTTADVTGIFSLDTNRLVGLAAKGSPDVTYLAGQDTPTSGIPLTATLSDGVVSLTSFRRAGQSDWTLAWQDALNESVATGKSIYVPPSMDPYYIAAPGIINGDGVSVKGHSYLYSRLS